MSLQTFSEGFFFRQETATKEAPKITKSSPTDEQAVSFTAIPPQTTNPLPRADAATAHPSRIPPNVRNEHVTLAPTIPANVEPKCPGPLQTENSSLTPIHEKKITINVVKKRRGKRSSKRKRIVNSNTWTLYHLNFRGLASKRTSFEGILSSFDNMPNVITMNETHMKFNSSVKLNGYKCLSRNRVDKSQGGIATCFIDYDSNNSDKCYESLW